MTRVRGQATLVAVCLAGVAGLACGGDDEGSSGPSAEALAKVRASDYARHVSLHASDVPYFEPIPKDEEEEDSKEERERDRRLLKCVGGKELPDPLTRVSSPEYGTQSPGELLRVGSTVEVAADAEDAGRLVTFIGSRRGERCLRHAYLSVIEEGESDTAEATDVSVSRIPFPAPDIENGYAYRFAATVTIHRGTSELAAYRFADQPHVAQTLRTYADTIGFVAGPAEVGLTAVGIPTPVSRTLERNLLRVLHERATEHRP